MMNNQEKLKSVDYTCHAFKLASKIYLRWSIGRGGSKAASDACCWQDCRIGETSIG